MLLSGRGLEMAIVGSLNCLRCGKDIRPAKELLFCVECLLVPENKDMEKPPINTPCPSCAEKDAVIDVLARMVNRIREDCYCSFAAPKCKGEKLTRDRCIECTKQEARRRSKDEGKG